MKINEILQQVENSEPFKLKPELIAFIRACVNDEKLDDSEPYIFRCSAKHAKLFNEFCSLKNKEQKIEAMKKDIEAFRQNYFGIFSTLE